MLIKKQLRERNSILVSKYSRTHAKLLYYIVFLLYLLLILLILKMMKTHALNSIPLLLEAKI